jgi:hypothetical protein
MSLKTFHLVFVSVCILLCLSLGAWWVWQWQAGNAMGGLWFGVGWFVAAAGLVAYGYRAIRKMESISYL